MKYKFGSLVALGIVLLSQQGQASIITFDNVGDFAIITNQYSGVVFSAGGGDIVVTHSQSPPYLGSNPNIICTAAPSATGNPNIDCTQDLLVTFTTPVDGLNFDAFGNQTPFGGTFALADIYQNNVLTATIPLTVSHFPDASCTVIDCHADHFDFSAFSGITQLVIRSNTDDNGTAYDNFSFTADFNQAPVPEPATLLLTGISSLICIFRRRRTVKS